MILYINKSSLYPSITYLIRFKVATGAANSSNNFLIVLEAPSDDSFNNFLSLAPVSYNLYII